MKEDFQKQYDDLSKQIENLQRNMIAHGYFLNEDKVIENKEVTGLFWEITHLYDVHSDGIYLCSYHKGAIEIPEEDVENILTDLKNNHFQTFADFLIHKVNIDEDAVERLKEVILEQSEDSLDGLIGNDDSLNVEVYLDDENVDEEDEEDNESLIGAFVDGSYIKIRKTTRKEIKSVKFEQNDSTYNP